MADLNFYQSQDGKAVKVGALTIGQDGEFKWSNGTKDFVKMAVDDLQMESKPGTKRFLDEIAAYLRNPYLWAARA
jgi:hypothetical protein